MNSEISIDQENKINEILESGINYLRRSPVKIKEHSYSGNNHITRYNNFRKENKNIEADSFEKKERHRKNKLKAFLDEIKTPSTNINEKQPDNESKSYKPTGYKRTIPYRISYDYKNEINDLQSNIDKLERKLFENASVSINSPLSTLTSNTKFFQNKEGDKTYVNEYKSSNSNIVNYTKNVLNKSLQKENQRFNYNNTIQSKSSIDSLNAFSSAQSFPNDNYVKEDFIKEERMKEDYSTLDPILVNSEAHLQRINFLEREVYEKQQIIEKLREELMDITTGQDQFQAEIQREKERNYDLLKEIKNLRGQALDYSDLNTKYLNLNRDFNLLSQQYEKSEGVRSEQNKMIKSLQREIDLLRNNNMANMMTKSKLTTNEDLVENAGKNKKKKKKKLDKSKSKSKTERTSKTQNTSKAPSSLSTLVSKPDKRSASKAKTTNKLKNKPSK